MEFRTLNRGCIWRVGKGDQINIWDDAWIPTSPTRKIYTPKGHLMLNKVSDLINPMTETWDEELIRDNFWSIDANRILKIPITPSSREDFLAWHFTNNGLFTVRSAYHAEWDYHFGRHNPDAMNIGGSHGSDVWKNCGGFIYQQKLKYLAGGRFMV